MSRVLVTGAAGYIGRHVVNQLLKMGQEVIASDFHFEGVDNRPSDVTSRSSVERKISMIN